MRQAQPTPEREAKGRERNAESHSGEERPTNRKRSSGNILVREGKVSVGMGKRDRDGNKAVERGQVLTERECDVWREAPALVSANPPVSSHKVGIALALCDSTANVTHEARCLVVGTSTWR
jgi:hypothetical protein